MNRWIRDTAILCGVLAVTGLMFEVYFATDGLWQKLFVSCVIAAWVDVLCRSDWMD